MSIMSEKTRKRYAKLLLDPIFIPDDGSRKDSLYQALTVVEESIDIFRNEYDGD